MKIIYIDDQKDSLDIVEKARKELTRLLEEPIDLFFLGTLEPGQADPLYLSEEGTKIPNGDELFIEPKSVLSQAMVDQFAVEPDIIFLLDVHFGGGLERYGLYLAKYLVSQGVSPSRIVLFTSFPERVRQVEEEASGTIAWFNYYAKRKFRLEEAPLRLACDLFGVIYKAIREGAINITPTDVDLPGIIGESPVMQEVFALVERIAETSSSVLITGESGTGKELTARAIHEKSNRRENPFLSINCAALPEQLLESELFGHKKGAFTGATADKKGLFTAANGGSVFLDEIGETSPAMQVKLLRVLQDGRIRPVGDTREIQTDVRIISATNRDLEARVAEGAFREDLYYRINVINLCLPPLRERREDIPLLVGAFIKKYARNHGRRIEGITSHAMSALERYHWPGNIRELENVVEQAIALERQPRISLSVLPDRLASPVSGPNIEGMYDWDAVVSELNDLACTIKRREKPYTTFRDPLAAVIDCIQQSRNPQCAVLFKKLLGVAVQHLKEYGSAAGVNRDVGDVLKLIGDSDTGRRWALGQGVHEEDLDKVVRSKPSQDILRRWEVSGKHRRPRPSREDVKSAMEKVLMAETTGE